jgi:hypothetical protein
MTPSHPLSAVAELLKQLWRPVMLTRTHSHTQARVLLNPGDAVLVEEFTFPHFVDADLLQMGCGRPAGPLCVVLLL